MSQLSSKLWQLEAQTELRFEAGATAVEVKLISGRAEIFGTEIVTDTTYDFLHANVAVFTWDGCKVELSEHAGIAYISKETMMVPFVNTHAVLEQMRKSDTPPRVMVVGPSDVGKSTLCRILVSYAARCKQQPLFVDLDLNEGVLPSSLCVLPISQPPDVRQGLANVTPLVYHYGHSLPSDNSEHFSALLSALAEATEQRFAQDSHAASGGCIVNTASFSKELMMLAREKLKINVILVIDHERLYNELLSELKGVQPSVSVVKLGKSGGVLARDDAMRNANRNQRIRQYFYGAPGEKLQPHSYDVPFSVLKIYKVGAPAVPAAALPIGASPSSNETQLVEVEPTSELLHAVLSVSSAKPKEDVEEVDPMLVTTTVLGFVCVQKVDMTRKMVTLLAPAPYPLPSTILLRGALLFYDAV